MGCSEFVTYQRLPTMFCSKYKLPKIAYKGDNVEDQFIQDRSQVPAIEEVSRPSASAPKPAAKQKQDSKQLSTVWTMNFFILEPADTIFGFRQKSLLPT